MAKQFTLTFKNIWLLCAAILVYVAVAKLSLFFASLQQNTSPIWPPSGVAFALLWLGGKRYAFSIFIAAFIVNYLTLSSPFAAAFSIALGNTAEALAVFALCSLGNASHQLFRRRQASLLFVIAAIFAPTISASVGILSLSQLTTLNADWAVLWVTWWLGDVSGLLICAPLIISFNSPARWGFNQPRASEFITALFCTALAAFCVFWQTFNGVKYGLPLGFLILPFLLWVALRFQIFAASFSLFLCLIIAVIGTFTGHGPFGAFPLNTALILSQLFFSVSAITLILVCATDAERFILSRAEIDSTRTQMDALNVEHETLRGREAWFKWIFNSTKTFVGLLDKDGRVLEANETALQAISAKRDDVVGEFFWLTPWWAHDLKQAERLRLAINAGAQGQATIFEAWHPLANGSMVYVLFSLTPVKADGKTISHLVVEGSDISEMKIAQQALSESEQRFRQLFEQNTDACLLLANECVVSANPAAARLFNFASPRSLLGLTLLQLSAHEQTEQLDSAVELAKHLLKTSRDGHANFAWLFRSIEQPTISTQVSLTKIQHSNQKYLYLQAHDLRS